MAKYWKQLPRAYTGEGINTHRRATQQQKNKLPTQDKDDISIIMSSEEARYTEKNILYDPFT